MNKRLRRDLRILLTAVVSTSLVVAVPAAAGTLVGTGRDGGSGPTAAARPIKTIDADTLDGHDSLEFLLVTGKAADADRLDGLDSTAFARTASQPFAATGTGGSGTLTQVGKTQAASVTVTAPEAGVLLLTAEASFDARETLEPSEVHAFLTENNVVKASAIWGPGDVDGLHDQHQTMTAAVPVSAGPHTFTLELQEWWTIGATRGPAPSGYVNPKVTATYLPGQG